MTRKLMLASAIAATLTGYPALALELGALRTDSALNQPFRGEIDLGDIRPEELDTLRISLAPLEAFEKAGIERYYYLTQLRFTPEVTADGRMRVRVSSRDPVREPYLDFLVEAVWPGGRLIKGYTVLLDPPALTERRAPNVEMARAASAASGPDRGLPPVARGSGDYIPAPGEGFPLYVGPVGGGEGLWSLARRHTPAGATDAQTAMALYRCNQGAFVRGNINRLIAGKTLVIPSRDELFALDAEEAWRELQAAIKGRHVRRAPLTDVTPEMLSRLRLVGVTPTQLGSPTPVAPPPATKKTEVQSPDVLLAIETSESARQEVLELRNRIKELETQLATIQSLLEVRNAELARMRSSETQGVEAPGAREGVEAEPDLRPALEPIAVPEPVGPQPGRLGQDTTTAREGPVETGAPVEGEPFDRQSLLAEEEGSATAEAEPGPESEPIPIPTPEAESTPESSDSGPAIGLIPVPMPTPIAPVASETPSGPTEEPTPKPGPVISSPEPEPPSTWHTLLLPLAGLAGVTALGILLFSLVVARRRRQEAMAVAEDEGDLESELRLDPWDGASQARESASSVASAVAVSPDKATPQADRQPAATAAAPDLDEASEPPLSGLTDFDLETEEADVLSEADIYLAYGRHREARDLLRKELTRYPQRLELKYKLAEVLATLGETEAMRDLLADIQSSGGDTAEPAQWERLQRLLSERAPKAEPPPVAPSPTSRTAPTGAGSGVPGLASPTESGSKSEDDLLLDLGDSSPLALDDSRSSADILSLELNSESSPPSIKDIERALAEDLDAILTLPDALGLDLNLPDGAAVPVTQPSATGASQTGAVATDLDLDLALEGLGPGSNEPHTPPGQRGPGRDRPADQAESFPQAPASDLSSEQEGPPSSPWQMESGVWDETATKLDLAHAYLEMGDQEAAREILEEVVAEGRDEQRQEARVLLERLGR